MTDKKQIIANDVIFRRFVEAQDIFTVSDTRGTDTDAHIRFTNDAATVSIGVDGSDSDKFVMSYSSALGTNNLLTASAGGAVSIPNGVLSVPYGIDTSTTTGAAVLVVKTDDNADAYTRYVIDANNDGSGVRGWATGVDQSDSSKYVISTSAATTTAPGTNNALEINVNSDVTIPNGTLTVNDDVTLSKAAGVALSTISTAAAADAQIKLSDATATWSAGVDNSASSKFVISNSATLGTDNAIEIDVAENVVIPNGTLTVNDDISISRTSGVGLLTVATTAAADSQIKMSDATVTWSAGVDNSASSKFVISNSATLGTDNAIEIDVAENVVIPNGTLTVNDDILITKAAGAATLTATTTANADAFVSYVAGVAPVTWSSGVDQSDSGKFKISNASAPGTNDYLILKTNGEVLVSADPISALGVATKQFVENFAQGIEIKASVKTVTDAALPTYTFAAGGTPATTTLTATVNASINNTGIGGKTDLVVTDRVLVTGDGTTSDVHNGIYTVTAVGSGAAPWVLTRASDFTGISGGGEVVSGTFTLVTEGTCINCGFAVVTQDPIVVDTDAIVITQFSGAPVLTLGLDDVLGQGNTTSGFNIVLSSGDQITTSTNANLFLNPNGTGDIEIGTGKDITTTSGNLVINPAGSGSLELGASTAVITTTGDLVLNPNGSSIVDIQKNAQVNVSSGAALLSVITAAAADSQIKLTDASNTFSLGVDNSASKFVIGNSATLGTNNAIEIDTSQNVVLPNGTLTVNDDVTLSKAAGVALSTISTAAAADAQLKLSDATATWSAGVDNSASSKFVISNSATLGTDNAIEIDVAENVVIPNGTLTVNDDVIIDKASGAAELTIDTAGTADSYINFIRNTENWSIGIDQSASDKFVISNAATLGTDNAFEIDTSQNVTIPGNLTVNGTLSATFSSNDNVFNIHTNPTVAAKDVGWVAERHGTDITGDTPATSGTSGNTGNTTTTIQLAVGDTQANDFYNGYYIKITSGAANGDVREVTDYVNATNLITVDPAFTAAPGADTYELFSHTFVGTIYDESADEMVMGFIALDGNTPVNKGYSNVRMGNLVVQNSEIANGDSRVVYTNDAQSWSAGVDGSDSDSFVISSSASLGTNNAIRINTTQDVSIPNGTLTVNDDITLSKAAGVSLLTVVTAAAADAQIKLTDASNTFSLGVDNSASKFVISNAAALGTNNAIEIDTSQNVVMPNGTLTVNDDITLSKAAGVALSTIATAAAADAQLKLSDATATWSAGIDNSASSKFVISNNATLGTDNAIEIDVSENVVIPNGTLTVNDDISLSKAAGVSLLTVVTAAAADAQIKLTDNTTTWSAGIDNSNGSKFIISNSATLGTDSAIEIDVNENVVVPNGTLTVNDDIHLIKAAGVALSNIQTAASADAQLKMSDAATTWSAGIDNSASSKFVISNNATLGTDNAIEIDVSENVVIPNGTLTVNDDITLSKAAGVALSTISTAAAADAQLKLSDATATWSAGVDNSASSKFVISNSATLGTDNAIEIDVSENVVIPNGTLTVNDDVIIDKASGAAELTIDTAGTADSYINFIRNTENWSIGIDQSDSDKFVISNAATLGTDNALEIDTSSNVVIPGNLTVNGTFTANISSTDNIFNIHNTPASAGKDVGWVAKRHQTDIIADTANETGTAQAGGATTITLATGANATDDFYNGWYITLTAGTGSGQTRIISDYVGATKVATVSVAWGTNPDGTSVYALYGHVYTGAIYDESADDIKFGYVAVDGDTPVSTGLADVRAGKAVIDKSAVANADAQLTIINDTSTFSLGVDASDSDKLVLSRSATLGTNNVLTVDSSDNVVIPNGTLTVNDDISLSKAAGVSLLTVVTAAAADSQLRMTDNTTSWSAGIDNSASSKFVISNSTALGTDNAIEIDVSENVVIPNGTLTVNDDVTLSKAAGVALSTVSTAAAADAQLKMSDATATWSAGIDNSDSSKFVISNSATLGTDNAIEIDVAENVVIPNGTLTVNDDISLSKAAGVSLLTVVTAAAADAQIKLTDASNTFSLGVDNSASKFVISNAAALGTNNALEIDTSQNVVLPNGTLTVNDDVTLTKAAGVSLMTVATAAAADAQLKMSDNTATWSAGVDNSASSKFVISNSATLGTDNAIEIDVNENIVMPNGTLTVNDDIFIDKAAGAAELTIDTAGTADSYINFIRNTENWAIGIDQSDSDKFVISNAATLGTDNALEIDTSSNVVIPGNLTVNGTFSASFTSTDNIFNIHNSPAAAGKDVGWVAKRHQTDIIADTANETGTAQAGGATTITLAAGANASDDFYNGYYVTLTAGTGSGQTRIISDYVGATKVATVSVAWGTNPDGTSVYSLFGHVYAGAIYDESTDDIKFGFIAEDGNTPLNTGLADVRAGKAVIDKSAVANADAQLTIINDTATYSLGVDASDSDKLVLSRSSTLGTNNVLTADSSDNVVIPNGTLTVNDDISLSKAAGVSLLTVVTAAAADAQIKLTDASNTFSLGVDNSASKFVIGNSATLGTNNALEIDTSQNVVMPNGTLTVNDDISLSKTAGISLLTVVTAAAADAQLKLTDNTTSWSLGADNSDSSKFVISNSASLGTDNAIEIDVSENVVIPNGTLTVNDDITLSKAAGVALSTVSTAAAADAQLKMSDNTATWSAGIDNSSASKFVISNSATLGTDNAIEIDVSENVVIPNGTLTVNDDISLSKAAGVSLLTVVTAAAADAQIKLIDNTATWSAGIDNSASSKFVIGNSATLGTNNAIEIDTSQNVVLPNGTLTVNDDVTLSKAAGVALSTVSTAAAADAQLKMSDNTATWSAGVDNSAASKFVISNSATLGTDNAIEIDVNENIVMPNGTLTVNDDIFIDKAAGAAELTIDTAGTADSYINFIRNTENWAIGIDQSDSDKFVISNAATLGTDNALEIDTSQNVVIPGNLTVNGTLSATFSSTDNIFNIHTAPASAGKDIGWAAKRHQTDIIADTANETGTAQAGGATTITLAAGANASDDFYNGYYVTLTAGTGSGQTRIISDYVGATKVATVSVAWGTNPDGTSVYSLFGHVYAGAIYDESADDIKFGFIAEDGNTPLNTGYSNIRSGDAAIDKSAIANVDAQLTIINDTATYALGVDASDSDKLVLSRSSTLGTNNVLTADSSDNVVIPNGTLTVNDDITLSKAAGASLLTVVTAAAADAQLKLTDNTATWSAGIDNSVSSKFVISNSATLGTDNAIEIDVSENVVIPNGTLTVNDDITLSKAAGVSLMTVATAAAADAQLKLSDATATWSAGVDNSASSKFVISNSATLGTDNAIEIDVAENIVMPNGTLTVNDNISLSRTTGVPLLTVSTAAAADSQLLFTNSATSWSVGIDTSASNRFIISESTTLGTNNVLRLDAVNDGIVGIGFNTGTVNSNVYIGNNTGTAATDATTGYNVFIGENAGTAVITGKRNVFIGKDAALTVTSGSGNVVIGKSAGSAMGTGAANGVIIGEDAGLSYSGASGLIAIGQTAATGITTGGDNIAIGVGSLTTETTGSRNIAIGTSANGNQDGGNDNVSLGYFAGLDITDGDDNILIGREAGFSVTSGSSNILIGKSAGANIETTSGTLIIGNAAGDLITSGTDNLLIGNTAGEDINTGSRNILIGKGAGNDLTTGSDNLMISVGGGGIISGTQNVRLGTHTSYGGSVDRTVAIGYNSSAGADDDIAIGSLAETDGTGKNIIIGNSAIADDGASTITNSVAIGYKARVSANNSVVLGSINGLNTATVTHKVARGIAVPTEALHIHDPDGAVAIKLSSDAAGTTNDVKFQWTTDDNGTPSSWVAGIDASTANADWVLSRGTTLGTTNAISVDGSTRNVTIPNDLTVSGVLNATIAEVFETLTATGAAATSGTTVLSTYDGGYNVTLADASTNGVKKTIMLLDSHSSRATVSTDQGSTYLDSFVNKRHFIYHSAQGVWKIVPDTSQDNFYPTTQQERKVGTSVVGGSADQGTSVALSADGNTMAIGGPDDNSGVGAVWIFVRAAGAATWTQQQKIIGTSPTGAAAMGTSVALSANGNVLAFGGPSNNSGAGRVWIWGRSGVTWTETVAGGIIGTGATGNANQGRSVALSSDGTYLAFGGPADNTNQGRVWVWKNTAGTWAQQTSFIGTGNVGAAKQGWDVDINADATIVAFGGPEDNTNQGAVWIFFREQSGTTWTEDTYLIGAGNTGAAKQGTSVAINSAGNTLAFGGPNDNTNEGRVWVFVKRNGTWEQQDDIKGTGDTGAAQQGHSVDLSADGNTLIFGGPTNNTNVGAVWVWTRSDSHWYEASAALHGTGGDGTESFGTSVALNSNGSTMAIGGPDDGTDGATWTYV